MPLQHRRRRAVTAPLLLYLAACLLLPTSFAKICFTGNTQVPCYFGPKVVPRPSPAPPPSAAAPMSMAVASVPDKRMDRLVKAAASMLIKHDPLFKPTPRIFRQFVANFVRDNGGVYSVEALGKALKQHILKTHNLDLNAWISGRIEPEMKSVPHDARQPTSTPASVHRHHGGHGRRRTSNVRRQRRIDKPVPVRHVTVDDDDDPFNDLKIDDGNNVWQPEDHTLLVPPNKEAQHPPIRYDKSHASPSMKKYSMEKHIADVRKYLRLRRQERQLGQGISGGGAMSDFMRRVASKVKRREDNNKERDDDAHGELRVVDGVCWRWLRDMQEAMPHKHKKKKAQCEREERAA